MADLQHGLYSRRAVAFHEAVAGGGTDAGHTDARRTACDAESFRVTDNGFTGVGQLWLVLGCLLDGAGGLWDGRWHLWAASHDAGETSAAMTRDRVGGRTLGSTWWWRECRLVG